MAGSEDTPAGTARGAGEVPEWVPVSPGGVNLLQVYELLALTPTERAQKLAHTVNALARMKAATPGRSCLHTPRPGSIPAASTPSARWLHRWSNCRW